MIVDVGGVHVGDHDALVALKMLRQLHAQLVRRCEVQRIIRCERLHDVVVAAALRFAELLFHRLKFRHRRPRYTVDAADKLLHRLFPVGDISSCASYCCFSTTLTMSSMSMPVLRAKAARTAASFKIVSSSAQEL